MLYLLKLTKIMKSTYFIVFFATILFVSCKNNSSQPVLPVVATLPTNPTTCYEMRLGKDLTAVELTLTGDDANGFYAWIPGEKDSAHGRFKGRKVGEIITAMYEYMIEGSIQTEEVMFKIAGNKLFKASGELEEKSGILMLKDKTKITWADEILTTTDCEKIKDAITNCKEITASFPTQNGENEAINPSNISITGTYTYDNGDRGNGELKISQVAADKFKFKLLVIGGAPAHNSGALDGTVNLSPKNVGSFSMKKYSGECTLQFSWGDEVTIRTLKGDAAACGFGNNVMADGVYKRKSFEDPFLSKTQAKAATMLIGTWQSTEDPKSSIKIADGQYSDVYEGQTPASPAMRYIYYPTCPKDCNPIAKTRCLKIIGQDDICYTVVKADGKVLEISQIGGRGNTNKYVKKK
jgi:hypothetical protein